MDCRHVKPALSAYIDRTLSLEAQAAVRRHLRQCVRCTVDHETARGRLLAQRSLSRVARPVAARRPSPAPATAGVGALGVAIFAMAGLSVAAGLGAISLALLIDRPATRRAQQPIVATSVSYDGGSSTFAAPATDQRDRYAVRTYRQPQQRRHVVYADPPRITRQDELAALAATARNEDYRQTARSQAIQGADGELINDLVADLDIGEAVGDGRLKIYPITAPAGAAGSDRSILTLDEAIAQGELDIHRASWQGLGSRRQTTKPVLALSGEVIRGGGQDQIIVRNTLIEPNRGGVFLATTCCEPDRLDSCIGCKYHAAGPMGPPAVRAAARLSGGGSIEQAVRAYHRDVGSNAPTKALADGVRVRRVRDAQKIVDVAALAAAVPEGRELRGFVAVVDGEMIALDVFDDASLADRLASKLVGSYAAGAATRLDEADGLALLRSPAIGRRSPHRTPAPGETGIATTDDVRTAIDRLAASVVSGRTFRSGRGGALTFAHGGAAGGTLIGDLAAHQGRLVHAGFVAQEF